MMGQKLYPEILVWPSSDHIKASFYIIIMNETMRSCLLYKTNNANDKITETDVQCSFRGNCLRLGGSKRVKRLIEPHTSPYWNVTIKTFTFL